MSNEEFLSQLERLLEGKLPLQELQNVMEYHREYFAEAGENAAAELDPPEVIAQRVLDEYFSPPPSRFPRWVKPAAICAGLAAAVLFSVTVWTGVLPDWFGRRNQRPYETVVREDSVAAIDQVTFTDTLQPGTAVQYGDQMVLDTSLPELVSIEIEGVSDNVAIVPGEGGEYILQMNYASRESLDYSVKDGSLYITGEIKDVFSTGYDPGEITVIVPFGAEFSRVSVKTDMGNVFMESINAQEVELETDMGDVNVSSGRYGSLSCESDVGDVLVTDVTADTLKGVSDCGNVEVLTFTAKETDLEADLGSVTAIATGWPEDYALELEVDLGEIKLNGLEEPSPYVTQGGDAGKRIKAVADVGNVTLDFLQDFTGEATAVTEE